MLRTTTYLPGGSKFNVLRPQRHLHSERGGGVGSAPLTVSSGNRAIFLQPDSHGGWACRCADIFQRLLICAFSGYALLGSRISRYIPGACGQHIRMYGGVRLCGCPLFLLINLHSFIRNSRLLPKNVTSCSPMAASEEDSANNTLAFPHVNPGEEG